MDREVFKISSLKNEERNNIKEEKKNMKVDKRLISMVLVVMLILVAGYYFVLPKFSSTPKKQEVASNPNSLNEKAWQAVFLSNGQVYFGRLNDLSGQFVFLNDIYYLQLDKPLQSTNPKDKLKEAEDQTKLQLIKLGKELHGPKDQMVLNRDHILFIEELSSDSKVVKSIDKYNQEKTKE